MSDKITKFLRKLSGREGRRVLEVRNKILANNLAGLDVKKLACWDFYYRVRVGRVRIIFESVDGKNEIIHITWRDDQTYRDF